MAPLTLTILGAGPAGPNAGGANSGYLLREGDDAVVMDCGSGTAGRIPLHVPVNRLTAVAISHLHPDHYFDLVALYYMLKYGEPRPADVPRLLPVFVPPGGCEFLRRFGTVIADKPAMFDDLFEVRDYSADVETTIGGLSFTFHRVQHYVMSHAMRIRAEGGATLVFSSDVAPCPQLIEAARGADLFLCESAMLDASQDEADPARRGHMSAREAGQAARQAGARRLLLTHYRSGETHDRHHLEAATSEFEGPVELAREGATYVVG
ncbi:MAG TPA: MBL fold metallo-hydrolase [Chloroflexota bacterium]|nr:MBL fold metallo-hydrolase [Chloroflexota bacterium]